LPWARPCSAREAQNSPPSTGVNLGSNSRATVRQTRGRTTFGGAVGVPLHCNGFVVPVSGGRVPAGCRKPVARGHGRWGCPDGAVGLDDGEPPAGSQTHLAPWHVVPSVSDGPLVGVLGCAVEGPGPTLTEARGAPPTGPTSLPSTGRSTSSRSPACASTTMAPPRPKSSSPSSRQLTWLPPPLYISSPLWCSPRPVSGWGGWHGTG